MESVVVWCLACSPNYKWKKSPMKKVTELYRKSQSSNYTVGNDFYKEW